MFKQSFGDFKDDLSGLRSSNGTLLASIKKLPQVTSIETLKESNVSAPKKYNFNDPEVELDGSMDFIEPMTIKQQISPQIVSAQAKEEVIKSLTNLVKSKSRLEVEAGNIYSPDVDLYEPAGNGDVLDLRKENLKFEEPKIKLMKVDVGDLDGQDSDESSQNASDVGSGDENEDDPPALAGHRTSAKGSMQVPMKSEEGKENPVT
jgi:hypothetical protein